VSARKRSAPGALARRLARLDPAQIDRLYGLEPVYEPSARAPSAEEFVAIRCPWCGERLDLRIDVSGGAREYIEDCQVCCRPMELAIECADSGALRAVRVRRLE